MMIKKIVIIALTGVLLMSPASSVYAATSQESYTQLLQQLVSLLMQQLETLQKQYAELQKSKIATVQQSTVAAKAIVEDFSLYNRVSLNKFTSNPPSYIGKKILVANYAADFMAKGDKGGDTNYIRIADPVSGSRAVVELQDSDSYAKVANAVSANYPIKAYGIGRKSVEFIQDNGVPVLIPVIETGRIDICPSYASYNNTGPDDNDPWVVGCDVQWKQIIP